MSDTRVYELQIRARLGTTTHFCKWRPDSTDGWGEERLRALVTRDRYLRLIDACITQCKARGPSRTSSLATGVISEADSIYPDERYSEADRLYPDER